MRGTSVCFMNRSTKHRVTKVVFWWGALSVPMFSLLNSMYVCPRYSLTRTCCFDSDLTVWCGAPDLQFMLHQAQQMPPMPKVCLRALLWHGARCWIHWGSLLLRWERMHQEDGLLQQEKAREGVQTRAMLLPGARLWLLRAGGEAARPFHRLPQVAKYGVQVLRAVWPPSPAGPARPPCPGRHRLPHERGGSGTPRARHLPRLRPAGGHELPVRLLQGVLVLHWPLSDLDSGHCEVLVAGWWSAKGCVLRGAQGIWRYPCRPPDHHSPWIPKACLFSCDFFFEFRYCSTFVFIWQTLSNQGVTRLKRFVSWFTDKLCN